MKALLYRTLIAENESFYQEDLITNFYPFLHYHAELQLTIILKRTGTLIVGDKICPFDEGDVFHLGSELPHVYRDTKPVNESYNSMGVHAISIYFKLNSFGENFFDLPENFLIKNLLQKSSRGIKFKGEITQEIKKEMLSLKSRKGADLLITFFTILNALSKSKEMKCLTSISFMNKKDDSESKRVQDIFKHVTNNFSREISLDEISKLSNMSVTSFCRFFKQRTRKTFTTFVNEVRIGYACKELLYKNFNINEVAYHCGFNNISNFNRQFKEVTGLTPSEYAKKMTSQD